MPILVKADFAILECKGAQVNLQGIWLNVNFNKILAFACVKGINKKTGFNSL